MQKISPNPTVSPIEKANAENRLLILEELYGVLEPYVNGYLSDEDIESAIAEGANEIKN